MTRAVAFAYSEVGYNCLDVLVAAGVDVALVVTHRDDPAESRWYRSVAELARRRGLKLTEFESLSATECLRALRSIGPDFLFSFYCRRMLGPEAEGLFTLFAIMFFFIGVVLLGVGLLGEFVARIYQQVRNLPTYLIGSVIEDDESQGNTPP